MTTWLVVNSVLGVLVLLFLKAMDDTPHQVRFCSCVAALVAWLVPWHYLLAFVPPTLVEPLALSLGSVQLSLSGSAAPGVAATQELAGVNFRQWPAYLLCGVLVWGLCLFLRALLDHARLLQHLAASARAHGATRVPSWLQNKLQQEFPNVPAIAFQDCVPGALTTGIRRKMIWVNARLAGHASLESVLSHELMHVRQHDNAWLWLITLMEKLFWWNPLVRVLAATARRELELRCDARCQQRDAGYRLALTRLVLDLAEGQRAGATRVQSLSSGIMQDAHFNVDRVRQLQRSLTMKSKHILATGVLAVGAFLAVGSPLVLSQGGNETEARARAANAQASAEQQAARERSRAVVEAKLAEIEARRGEVESERELRERQLVAGLEVYAENLEAAYSELERSKAELEARVRELEERLAGQD